jgi:hypothetical protein
MTTAAAPVVRAETRKKLTLLVGKPVRTATNLLIGRLFMYLVQFTSKKGRAIIVAANATLQMMFKAFNVAPNTIRVRFVPSTENG